jgi:MFS family permease
VGNDANDEFCRTNCAGSNGIDAADYAISLAAGAIADMYDRRIVEPAALSVTLAGATALSILAHLNLVTPITLLAFCFIIGTGTALFGPAWQASVSEQVPS